MKALWPTVNLSSPGIARRARRYELKLRHAVALAAKKDCRRDPQLAALYTTARVEGVDSKLRMKRAVVTFSAPPFRGGLHQSYDWTTLDEFSVREIAETLAWSLRESLRRRCD
jgi:hypothetical protein